MTQTRVLPLYSSAASLGEYCALVDASDWRKLRTSKVRWRVHWNGGKGKKKGHPYARASINGKYVYLHRFLMGEPRGMEVDHKNHQTLDCRKSNLEVVSRVVNNRRRRNSKVKDTHEDSSALPSLQGDGGGC